MQELADARNDIARVRATEKAKASGSLVGAGVGYVVGGNRAAATGATVGYLLSSSSARDTRCSYSSPREELEAVREEARTLKAEQEARDTGAFVGGAIGGLLFGSQGMKWGAFLGATTATPRK